MADKKVSQLTALTGANTASGDLLYIVDISEPVAADQSKKITLTEFQSAPISAGTANGVAFLNASKVLTTGSALTFDGTNLGVGTSSPDTKLTVTVADAAISTRFKAATGIVRFRPYVDATFGAVLDSTNPAESAYLPLTLFGSTLRLFGNSATGATIDSSGNLGLGVTPSAWGSGFKALQIGGYGALWNVADAYISSSNIYSDGARKYLNTGFATEYLQYSLDGSHRFYTAPSGTIDTAVTITERFKITPTEAVFNDPGDDYDFRVESDTNTHAFFVQGSDGYVGIGTSSPSAKLDVRGQTFIDNVTASTAKNLSTWNVNGTNYAQLYDIGTTANVLALGGSGAVATVPSTPIMAWDLDNSNVGIGTSSPGAKLHVYSAAATTLRVDNGDNASAQTIALATGGVDRATLSIASSSADLVVRSESTGGRNSGIQFWTGNTSTERMRLDSSGNLGLGVTPSAWGSAWKAFDFNNRGGLACGFDETDLNNNVYRTNTGAYFYKQTAAATTYNQSGGAHIWLTAPSGTAGDAITFTQAMTLDASGNLLVGRTSRQNSGRVEAKAASGEQCFVAQVASDGNSLFQGFASGGGSATFQVTGDGSIYGKGVYDNTTASAANVFVDSDGRLVRSASSLKYKRDVQDATHGLAEVMALRPVTYKGKSEADGNTVFGGLIAEEVHAAGLTEFVQYAEDGSPDALAYGNMVSLLTKAIQEQQAMINELKAKVAALQGA